MIRAVREIKACVHQCSSDRVCQATFVRPRCTASVAMKYGNISLEGIGKFRARIWGSLSYPASGDRLTFSAANTIDSVSEGWQSLTFHFNSPKYAAVFLVALL